MAVYNAEAWLAEALDSVLAQTEPAWELLCIDDASTDDSLSILRDYASRDARVHVLPQSQNRGAAVARNVGLREARGEWVMMLDADDWLSPDSLQRALDCEASDVDAIVLQLIHHYPDRPAFRHSTLEVGSLITGVEALRLSLDWTLHGLILVRRELHLRYPYDDRLRLYSDDNTSRFHYLHSRKVAISGGEYHYRHHPESNTMAVSPKRFLHLRANWQMAEVLKQEGVEDSLRRHYETIRWQNYVSLLRLYHNHRAQFGADDMQWVEQEFRSLYPSFRRRMPYRLFVCRQWLGYLWHRLR